MPNNLNPRRNVFAICFACAFLIALPKTVRAQYSNNASSWSFRTGMLVLDSGGSMPDRPFLTRGNLVPVMQSGEIDGGTGIGWEMELSKKLSRHWEFDARYSSIDSFGEVINRTNLNFGAGVLFSNTVLGVLGAVNATAETTYGADLSSIEVSAKRRLNDWLKLSVGVRQLQFDDHAAVRISANAFSSQIGLSASNQMTGGQIGSEIVLLDTNRFSLLANGLAGIYYNDIDTGLIARTNITRSSTFETNRTSFIGELELKGRLLLTKHLYLEGGYRLLFLEDIAMATEQAAVNRAPSPATPMTAADTNDNRMLQGATASVVFLF